MRDSCATCEILDCHDDDICGLIEFRRKRRSHYAAGSSHQTGAASKRVKHTKTGRPGVGGVGGRPSAVLVHVFLSKLLTRVSKTTFVWVFLLTISQIPQGQGPLGKYRFICKRLGTWKEWSHCDATSHIFFSNICKAICKMKYAVRHCNLE